jgi:hypothetical protein
MGAEEREARRTWPDHSLRALAKIDEHTHRHISQDVEPLVEELLSTYCEKQDRCRCGEFADDLRAALRALAGQIESTGAHEVTAESEPGAPPNGGVGCAMTCRAGITTRPEDRKREWRLEHPTMRHWEVVGPFASRQEAQSWEDRQRGCERSGGGDEPDYPGARWYGYRFDY